MLETSGINAMHVLFGMIAASGLIIVTIIEFQNWRQRRRENEDS